MGSALGFADAPWRAAGRAFGDALVALIGAGFRIGIRVAIPGFKVAGFGSTDFRERLRLGSDLAFGVAVVCGRRVFWVFMATARGGGGVAILGDPSINTSDGRK